MDELITFLRARLDEDERTAHKTAALCGCHPEAPSWSFDDKATDGRIIVDNDPHPDIKRRLGRRWNGTYEGMFAAVHVARHDPARVLRDVKAKREIVDEHQPANPDAVPREGEPGWPDRPWFYCKTCGSGEANEYPTTWPCRTLRLLALPYAGQPAYRAEWRP